MDKEKRLAEITARMKELQNLLHQKDEAWYNDEKNLQRSFEEFWEYRKPEVDEHNQLDREKRLLMPYKLSPIPDYGDVMSLKDFISDVKAGNFIDYDGSGNYVKDGLKTNISIYPSDIKHNAVRNEFDTIIWFNR